MILPNINIEIYGTKTNSVQVFLSCLNDLNDKESKYLVTGSMKSFKESFKGNQDVLKDLDKGQHFQGVVKIVKDKDFRTWVQFLDITKC